MKKIYLFIGLFLVLPFYGQQNCLNFDGVDDQVLIANSQTPALLIGSKVLTVEAWVRPALASYPDSGPIVSNHISNTQFALRATSAGAYEFFIGFGTYVVSSPENSLKKDVWQHIVGVYDTTSIKIYIDGVLQGTTAVDSSYFLPFSGSDIFIGYDGYPLEKFSGGLYDIRIWRKAATINEIATNMNAVLTGNEDNLLAYYKFNQGMAYGNNTTVTTLIDSSVYQQNGILSGFDLNGNFSNWLDKTYLSLSTEQFDSALKLSVAPNPTSDFVSITGFNSSIVTAEVYDVNGRKIFSKKLNQTESIVSLKNLSSGIYFIKIISDKSVTTTKVIKN